MVFKDIAGILKVCRKSFFSVKDTTVVLNFPNTFPNILDLCHDSGFLKLRMPLSFWYLSMDISDFGQTFKMVMVSLIEKYRIRTKFQNDYVILNFHF